MTEINIPKEFNQRAFVKVITERDEESFNCKLKEELQKLYNTDHIVLNIDIKQPITIDTGSPQLDYEQYTGVIIYAKK